MIRSMTGFGRSRRLIPNLGRVSFEIRSLNHRFLDIVLHLPEGSLQLEQRLKDAISRRITRGHIVCRLEIDTRQLKKPVLNKQLIKEYYFFLKQISQQFNLKQDININTLTALPGVWSIQPQPSLSISWNKIRPLLKDALDKLIERRQQEGRATYKDLNLRAHRITGALNIISARFNKIIKQRLNLYESEEEKNSFLRSSDINEEIVRLSFHLKNFNRCLRHKKAVGKELDFILQEMQREANTISAKSIDALVSKRVIGIKSDIEKVREQVQNVE